jgi:hypothetical protein
MGATGAVPPVEAAETVRGAGDAVNVAGVGGVGGVAGVGGVGGVCTTGVPGVAGVVGAAMPPVAEFVCVTGPVTAPGLSMTTWTLTFTGPVWAAAPVPAAASPASPGVMTTCTDTGCGALRSARATGAVADMAVAPTSIHPRRPIIAR